MRREIKSYEVECDHPGCDASKIVHGYALPPRWSEVVQNMTGCGLTGYSTTRYLTYCPTHTWRPT